MKTMVFDEVETSYGKVEFSVTTEEKGKDRVFFDLEKTVVPDPNEIATAMVTFAGTAFDSIHIDLPVDPSVRERLERFTRATITTNGTSGYDFSGNGTTMLSFSGGFDSLAAYLIMPTYTHLVSGNFLGNYEREGVFFQNFATHVYSTNFRQLGYNKNTPQFMGAGTCLYRSHLNASYISFGTILEAVPHLMRSRPNPNALLVRGPFNAIGMNTVRPTIGMTELVTAMVVSEFIPEQIDASLKSLAYPNSEKMVRKQILLALAKERFGFHTDLAEPEECTRKHFYGQQFASSSLALYILKYGGMDRAMQTLVEIPEDVVDFAQNHRLTFYERYNPDFVIGFNAEEQEYIFTRLKLAGVQPYDEDDFIELHEAGNFVWDYVQKYRNSRQD